MFLQKLFTKCGGETTPRLFSKKSKLIISLRFYKVCFYCMPSLVLSADIETKFQTTSFFYQI